MTTVTIRETPSEAIINKGTAIETIAAGARTISLRKPTVLGQYRLVEFLGESAKNQVYMQMVLPLLWVVEIDGVAVKTPVTKLQLEALIQQLDEDGLEAVMQHLGQTLAQPDAGGEALKN